MRYAPPGRQQKEGDIFAEAAPLIRRRIREALREPDCQPADILAAKANR